MTKADVILNAIDSGASDDELLVLENTPESEFSDAALETDIETQALVDPKNQIELTQIIFLQQFQSYRLT